MKKTYGFLFLLGLSLNSCIEDLLFEESEFEETVLESLFVSEESSSYLDFYSINDQIILEKSSTYLGDYEHENDITTIKDDYANTPERRVWTITKQGELTSEFKSRSCTVRNAETRGGIERKGYEFKDDLGNTFKFRTSVEASVDCRAKSWDKISENFQVSYSDPCTSIYIDHRTFYFRDKPTSEKKETVKIPIFKIGSKEYKEVMKLKEVRASSHFVFYVSKEAGIIRIDDLDHQETWLVDDK